MSEKITSRRLSERIRSKNRFSNEDTKFLLENFGVAYFKYEHLAKYENEAEKILKKINKSMPKYSVPELKRRLHYLKTTFICLNQSVQSEEERCEWEFYKEVKVIFSSIDENENVKANVKASLDHCYTGKFKKNEVKEQPLKNSELPNIEVKKPALKNSELPNIEVFTKTFVEGYKQRISSETTQFNSLVNLYKSLSSLV